MTLTARHYMTAFDLGRRAALRGLAKSCCPYPREYALHGFWLDGWMSVSRAEARRTLFVDGKKKVVDKPGFVG